jgi:hypothetical protein
MKKKWSSPTLIILLKGRPEENVLAMCKYNKAPLGSGGVQADTLGHGCQATRNKSCQACQSLGAGNKS